MTWLMTHSRSRLELHPQRLNDNTIHWDDIATQLAKQCRFNGACPGFYSVAEHSVYVSHLVPEHLRFAALLHDAAEAYLGDIIRPIKGDCPAYCDTETRLLFRIFAAAGVVQPSVGDARLIRAADNAMLVREWEWFFPGEPPIEGLEHVQPADIRIVGLDWQDARQLFIQRFDEVKPSHLKAS